MCLAWALGTDLTQTLCRTRRVPSPLQPELTHSHVLPQATFSRARLTAALCSPAREPREHGFAWGR